MQIDGTAITDFVNTLPRHRTVFHARAGTSPDRVTFAGVLELGLVWHFTGSDNLLADYEAAVPDSVLVGGVSP